MTANHRITDFEQSGAERMKGYQSKMSTILRHVGAEFSGAELLLAGLLWLLVPGATAFLASIAGCRLSRRKMRFQT